MTLSSWRAPRPALAAVSLALVLGAVACGDRDRAEVAPASPAPEPAVVEVGPENLVLVGEREISIGPLVSGALRPAIEATVRAEVGGSVLFAALEEGQAVRKGALLARIEQRTLGDAVTSAQSALRSAEQALGVARREAERTERLVKAGAIAERELETAQNAVTAAEAQVDDARTRLASARKELEDTTVRAPISGIVSRRHVSVGDVVAPGRSSTPSSTRRRCGSTRRCRPRRCPRSALAPASVRGAGLPGSAVRGPHRAHQPVGRSRDAAGADLRRHPEHRWPAGRRAVRRGSRYRGGARWRWSRRCAPCTSKPRRPG